MLDRLRGWFRRRSLERGDLDRAPEKRVDAMAVAATHRPAAEGGPEGGGLPPPGYVPPADEGRPRH
jgi:hypothetical protein